MQALVTEMVSNILNMANSHHCHICHGCLELCVNLILHLLAAWVHHGNPLIGNARCLKLTCKTKSETFTDEQWNEYFILYIINLIYCDKILLYSAALSPSALNKVDLSIIN